MATLEQWGTQEATDAGLDPNEPSVQERIVSEAAEIRAANPGLDDTTILAQEGAEIREQPVAAQPAAPAMAAPPAMPAAPAPAPTMMPSQRMQAVQEQFTPEAEAALQKQTDFDTTIANAGRALSSSARIAAGPDYAKQLDQGFNEQVQRANKPLLNWRAKKQQAVANAEQMIKAGTADRDQMKDEFLILGFQQVQEERANAAAKAAAEADPQSASSDVARAIAKQAQPALVAKLGDKFDTMSATMLKQYLPALEKSMEAELARQEKEYDRVLKRDEMLSRENIATGNNVSRERAAATTANARLTAARIAADSRASAGPAAPKTADLLRAQREDSNLGKEQRGLVDKADAAKETILLFDRVKTLIDEGLETGPIAGSKIGGQVYSMFSGKKQEAEQIGAQLVSTMAKTFGAAPSDAESRLIREANDVQKLDNPGPALAALRSKFERQLQKNTEEAGDVQELRNATMGTVGQMPRTNPVPQASVVRMTKNGESFDIPADRVQAARAAGYK